MKKYDETKILDIGKEEFAEIESKINLQKKKVEEELEIFVNTHNLKT